MDLTLRMIGLCKVTGGEYEGVEVAGKINWVAEMNFSQEDADSTSTVPLRKDTLRKMLNLPLELILQARWTSRPLPSISLTL